MRAAISVIFFIIFNMESVLAADFDCKYWLKASKYTLNYKYATKRYDYENYEHYAERYLKNSFHEITKNDLDLWRKQVEKCNFGGFLSIGKKETASILLTNLNQIQSIRESYSWGDKDDLFIYKYNKRIDKILFLPDEPSTLRKIQSLFEDLDFYDGPRSTIKIKRYIKDAKQRLTNKYKPIHENQKYGSCGIKLKKMKISENDLSMEIHSMNPNIQTIKDALCVAINGKSKVTFSKEKSKFILKIKNARNNIHLYFTFYDKDKKLILTHMANPKSKWLIKELTDKNAQYILANYYSIAKE